MRPRRSGSAALAVVAAASVAVQAGAPSALGHPPPRAAVRELVRIQGHRVGGTAGDAVLVALGIEHRFAAAAWERYGLSGDETAPPPERRLVLQGKRDLLARFAAARPDQTVTILGERRPGSADLFVLALDLCPPR
jgi:hypothetical protein